MKNKKGGWTQGYFDPQHPEKCINIAMGKKPFFRSSWEWKVFSWADQNKNVVRWGSEILKIPYIYDVDKHKGKTHNYFPDLYCEIRNKEGTIDKYVLEVKPVKQKYKPPKPKNPTKKAMQNYLYAYTQWVKNQNKWKYANMYCEGKNWKFRILTENQIFNGEIK